MSPPPIPDFTGLAMPTPVELQRVVQAGLRRELEYDSWGFRDVVAVADGLLGSYTAGLMFSKSRDAPSITSSLRQNLRRALRVLGEDYGEAVSGWCEAAREAGQSGTSFRDVLKGVEFPPGSSSAPSPSLDAILDEVRPLLEEGVRREVLALQVGGSLHNAWGFGVADEAIPKTWLDNAEYLSLNGAPSTSAWVQLVWESGKSGVGLLESIRVLSTVAQ